MPKSKADPDLNGFLTPTKEVLSIKGKLSYSESSQAWSVLKIKKDIFHIFPQLKEKRSEFSYHMIVPRSFEEAKEKFDELTDKVPILLFFEKEKVVGDHN